MAYHRPAFPLTHVNIAGIVTTSASTQSGSIAHDHIRQAIYDPRALSLHLVWEHSATVYGGLASHPYMIHVCYLAI